MSQYIVLERIAVQNANAVSGFTWGFPAITHFLGFTHALSRKLEKKHQLRLTGCAVISHDYATHTYQPTPNSHIEFIQSKCPASTKKQAQKLNTKKLNAKKLNAKKPSNPSIVEEGKMNLSVSLIIVIDKVLSFKGSDAESLVFADELEALCYQHKLAGGSILSIQSVFLYGAATEKEKSLCLRRIKRKLMPGFVLRDRSEYLQSHFESDNKVDLLDAWLDFSAMKYQATAKPKKKEKVTDKTKAEWERIPKPSKGWLVPIMTGYKNISDLNEKGKVANVRDETVPACFVEAVHSVGEWQGVHRINQLSDYIWQYDTSKQGWYLCKQQNEVTNIHEHQSIEPMSVADILANL